MGKEEPVGLNFRKRKMGLLRNNRIVRVTKLDF
jgi:hypothetical protein